MLLYDTSRSAPTPLHKLASARSYAAGQAISRLDFFATEAKRMSDRRLADGRTAEAAFWLKIAAKAIEAIGDVNNGSDGMTQIRIVNDYIRARLFDLKCAVDIDNDLPGAKADTSADQTGRQVMSKGVV